MRKSILPTVAVLLVATPTFAQDKPASSTSTAKLDPKDERITCRAESHTGSHISQSVCRSAVEWRELDQATNLTARRFVDMVVRRSSVLSLADEQTRIDQLQSDPDAAWRD